MIEEPVGREADTYRPVPLRRFLTLAAALVFGAAVVVRLVGHVRGTTGSSAVDVVGTVLLAGFALVLAVGAVIMLTNVFVVDDTEVVQRVWWHERSLPLEPGTELTLRRELRGAPNAKSVVWKLRVGREGRPPIHVDTTGAPDFASVLDHVAAAGHHHPGLLTEPTLLAVIADPALLDASASELEVAVDDVRRSR